MDKPTDKIFILVASFNNTDPTVEAYATRGEAEAALAKMMKDEYFIRHNIDGVIEELENPHK